MSDTLTKIPFTVNEAGKDIKLLVRRPSTKDREEAAIYRGQMFAQYVAKKFLLQAEVQNLVKERGLWTDADQLRVEELTKDIVEGEIKLKKGGALGLKKSQGRAIALEMRKKRAELSGMRTKVSELDRETAQSHADDAEFRYLVFACTINEQLGRRHWQTFDHFLAAQDRDDETAKQAANNLSRLLYNFDNDWWSKLPENAWLVKHGFAIVEDGVVRLVDKDKNYITEDGRRVDKDGNFLGEKGEKVDRFGNALDDKGEYIVGETQEFLDD